MAHRGALSPVSCVWLRLFLHFGRGVIMRERDFIFARDADRHERGARETELNLCTCRFRFHPMQVVHTV